MGHGTEADDAQPQEPDEDARRPAKPDPDTVLLRDLAPRKNVKGGAGKLRFGESPTLDEHDEA